MSSKSPSKRDGKADPAGKKEAPKAESGKKEEAALEPEENPPEEEDPRKKRPTDPKNYYTDHLEFE